MKNLRKAYKKARKGKGAKWYVKDFDNDLEKNLLQLQKDLFKQTYEPKPMKTFIIRDPKTRVISASAFRDRVVHHALCNIIEPIFDKVFICDSYANRKGKGTHAALKWFDFFMRKVSMNGKLLSKANDNNQIYGYALKADIRHYFDSVDHKVMMHAISRRIQDERILWLVKKILDNHNGNIPGKGMPIGNLTSQFFANVYLRLRAKYYIRYVDDFVILDASKERLDAYKIEINEFLKTIKLELHPQKSKVVPLHEGIKFLGFRVFCKYKLPKKGNVTRFKHRVENFIDLYKDGIIDKPSIIGSVEGWNAYIIHANSYKFRNRMMKKLRKALREPKPA